MLELIAAPFVPLKLVFDAAGDAPFMYVVVDQVVFPPVILIVQPVPALVPDCHKS